MAKTVLIVDDNAVIRRLLCEIFTSESDFDVCGEAENGREALEKAQTMHPDLIVMDLSMPLMNGIDAARTLKRLMPPVQLIMFTVYNDALSEEEARSAGVSAVVSKSEPAFCPARQSSCFALRGRRVTMTSFPNQETQHCLF
jgi:two-component system chemotaxis response regulator CheY